MASSQNLIHPSWRPSLDFCFADYLAPDALNPKDAISPFAGVLKPDPSSSAVASTPTVSGQSGASDQDPTPRRRGRGSSVPAATGRVTKRKSRASKRSLTTFITADAANFRQMVQQVTGVKFGGEAVQVKMTPVLKPEPMRPGCGVGITAGGMMPAAAGCLLPTLDTSAFLLDHHRQQVLGPHSASYGHSLSDPSLASFAQTVGGIDASPSFNSTDFDVFSSFPNLESWKVV